MANPAPAVPPPGLCISEPTARRGRSLRATRHFTPGSQIAIFNSPLLAIPDGPHALATCNWCLGQGSIQQPPSSISACTGCRCVAYCSKRCQGAAWRHSHNLECGVFQRVKERTGKEWVPTPVRAAILLLFRLKKGDEGVRAAVGDVLGDESEKGTLEGNMDSFRRDEKVWTDLEMQAGAAATYAGFAELARRPYRVMDLMCKLQTNAFDRSDPDSGAAGIFLDSVLAMANHSCIPNAFICFSGRMAILRAEMDIKEGDEIEISYIDYTRPKAERHEALRLYHFQCQCPRCADDLDVYQVCQRSALIPMNLFSLQPDLQKLRDPPIDRLLYERTETGLSSSRGINPAGPKRWEFDSDPLGESKQQWPLCKPLLEAGMFACEPVPSVIQALSNHYQASGNFAFALCLACFLTTGCHPYAHVAPFRTWRVKGLMLTAGLLSQTAPLSATGELADACPHKELVASLSRCDQVSMCEALLRMVVQYGPMAHSEHWEVLGMARTLLEDIESLQGRERESMLLRAWAANPQNPDGRAFFEEVVLKPVREVAGFAVGIVTTELDNDGSAVAIR